MGNASYSFRQLATGSLLALAVVYQGAGAVKAQQAEAQRIGLDGYCPVCLVEAKKWEKGAAEHSAVYDGVTYRFPNEAIKKTFLANPAKYVPALGGDCVVCYAKLGKRVPGSTDHVVRYMDRIFLFPGKEQKEVFLKTPGDGFAGVDLALKGDCAVCQVQQGKHVAGKAEFAEVYHGFRYLFPSAEIQAEFRKDPARYAAAAMKTNGKSAQRRDNSAGKKVLLTVAGKTACASCEYGVTPIENPEELGLAVQTNDGKIVIVERAHQLYQTVYNGRFAGQSVRASGHILKQEGRFTWIEPTELTVLK